MPGHPGQYGLFHNQVVTAAGYAARDASFLEGFADGSRAAYYFKVVHERGPTVMARVRETADAFIAFGSHRYSEAVLRLAQ